MAKRRVVSRQTKGELVAEVTTLQTRVKELESQLGEHSSRRHTFWRKFGVWVATVLAAIVLVFGNLFFWAGNTYVNTDKYVATFGPLIEKPEIQTAVSQYVTTQIFERNNVQAFITEVLPPRADFLAPQLTAQLRTQTQNTLRRILSSEKMQKIWVQSLTRAHTAIIKFAKNYQGNGTITVSDVYGQLSQRLATTKLSFLANKSLPSNVASIQIATAGWLPVLHNLAVNIGLYQILATILFIAFVVLAVWLSNSRRKTVIRLGITFFVLMLATLVAIRLGGHVISNKVASEYQSAVQVAYQSVTSSLIVQTRVLALLGILLSLIAWISGPYRFARKFRDWIQLVIAGKLHQAIFGAHENGFTRFVGRYRTHLMWLAVLIIGLVMILVELSPKLILIYVLLMIVIVLFIALLAAPAEKIKR